MRGAELRRWRFRFARGERRGLAAHSAQRPTDRVVRARHHALLERDDRVVGDVDVLRAHVRAALGDVAVAEPVLLTNEFGAIVRVERMHLERREPHEVARAREPRLVLLVVADDVTHVLAEEALDALMELLHALDVVLVHAARAVGFLRLRLGHVTQLPPVRRPSRSASPRRGAPAARSGPRAATRYATRLDRRAAA